MVDSGDEKTKQHEGYSPLHMFVIYLPAWIVLGEWVVLQFFAGAASRSGPRRRICRGPDHDQAVPRARAAVLVRDDANSIWGGNLLAWMRKPHGCREQARG